MTKAPAVPLALSYRTGPLVIRSLEERDRPTVYAWESDPQFRPGYPRKHTMAPFEEFFARLDRQIEQNAHHYLVLEHQSAGLIGICALPVDHAPADNGSLRTIECPSLDIFLVPAAQALGYGHMIAKRLINIAFEELNAPCIKAQYRNPRVRGFAERLGFAAHEDGSLYLQRSTWERDRF